MRVFWQYVSRCLDHCGLVLVELDTHLWLVLEEAYCLILLLLKLVLFCRGGFPFDQLLNRSQLDVRSITLGVRVRMEELLWKHTPGAICRAQG